MTFNSLVFLAFFVAVLAMYWALRTRRSQNLLLLGASWFFYGYGDPRFLALIILCALTGYSAGRLMEKRPQWRRCILAVGVLLPLFVLGYFKYAGFFVDAWERLLRFVGLPMNRSSLDVLLPIGISFFTFQTIAYVVDVYCGKQQAESNLVDFLLFISFFPQLVAGPIERAEHLLPQFKRQRSMTWNNVHLGVYLVLQGMVKKVVIADNVAPAVDTLFRQVDLPAPMICTGLLLFAVQIYGDFSGYSDIARGAARLLGFDLSVNFRHPYMAVSPSDFWRRWHITLSNWYRDYVYVRLGGNRKGATTMLFSLMITMALCGLWHGAAWNFVVWGLYHGLVLAVFHALRHGWTAAFGHRFRPGARVATMLTFSVVTGGWLFFRVEDFGQIARYLLSLCTQWHMFDVAWLVLASLMPFIALAVAVDLLEPVMLGKDLRTIRVGYGLVPAYGIGLVLLAVFLPEHSGSFIYFRF